MLATGWKSGLATRFEGLSDWARKILSSLSERFFRRASKTVLSVIATISRRLAKQTIISRAGSVRSADTNRISSWPPLGLRNGRQGYHTARLLLAETTDDPTFLSASS